MDRREDIIQTLQQNLDATVAFFESLTPDQQETRVYQDGAQWTARQVVAHLITIERSMHRLFNDILAGGEGSPKDFDVDRFNKSQTQKLDRFTTPELLAQFKQVRNETAQIVAAMTDQDLDRQGRHAFHGQGRLERFIRWAYEHTRIHTEEIQQAMGLSDR